MVIRNRKSQRSRRSTGDEGTGESAPPAPLGSNGSLRIAAERLREGRVLPLHLPSRLVHVCGRVNQLI